MEPLPGNGASRYEESSQSIHQFHTMAGESSRALEEAARAAAAPARQAG